MVWVCTPYEPASDHVAKGGCAATIRSDLTGGGADHDETSQPVDPDVGRTYPACARLLRNGVVQTPNLDRLAARGTVFTDAYTPVPICVPARASFATGLYGHATGHWDNATPYTGTPRGWGHAMQDTGRLVGSIGKLHYRNGDDPVGLDFQEIAMHVVNGVGDVLGCVREPLPKRWKSHAMAENIGLVKPPTQNMTATSQKPPQSG